MWQIGFEFGQTERGLFQLEVPRDYLVEKVDGGNVRGWDLDDQGGQNLLNVELLKSVKQREQFTVHLSHRLVLAARDSTQVDIPVVAIPDAALHRGVVRIRRSPILDLQTLNTSGVTRTDAGAATAEMQAQLSESESPLGVQDYQAYEFKSTPFAIRIAAAEIQPSATAELRTLAKIGESESTLESEVIVSTRRRTIYRVRVRSSRRPATGSSRRGAVVRLVDCPARRITS